MAVRRTPLERVRNIGIMAHIDAGKTTVSERILYYSGRTHRIAEVHDGEATMDWMDQERERGITITSAVTSVDWNNHEIHLIDTPGHVDFTVEVERSLRVLDGVIALYDAVAGVEPQSETVWYQADRYKVPRLGFANKMDRPGASFMDTVEDVRDTLKAHPIPVQIPMGAGNEFHGVIDLVEMEAMTFSETDQGITIERGEIPEEFTDEASKAREKMVELLADVNDDIAMMFLEGEEIPADDFKAALRQATIDLEAVPFLCGSGLRNKGVQPLLDAVVDYLPNPLDLPPVEGTTPEGEPATRERTDDAPFSALAFKVQIIDGREVVYVRIYSGVLESGTKVLNTANGKLLRVKNILRMHAKRRERVDEALAGELVALANLKLTGTGDTLCDKEDPIILEPIEARKPVISVAVEPESLKEKDKLTEALDRLTTEDPTLVVEQDEDTGDLIMRGMGELHLEVVSRRLKDEFNVGIRLGTPNVVRKETITDTAESWGEFIRQVDDDRIFGRVRVKVSPRERTSGNQVVMNLDEEIRELYKDDLLKVIENGVLEAMSVGPVSGEELVDVHAEVTGLAPDPDGGSPSEIGYRVAAGEALRNAVKAAGSVTLEPLMDVDIVVQEENVGEIIGDLTARGGVIQDTEKHDLRMEVHAIVPLRKMFGYTSALRSMTQGRGAFSMNFRAFDTVG